MERAKLFNEIKRKLEEETKSTLARKELMENEKANVQKDLKTEMALRAEEHQKIKLAKEEEARKQKLLEEQNRKRNQLLSELNEARQKRALQVLNQLNEKGVKKVGKKKVSELMNSDGDLDYYEIINFYQTILKREKELFEQKKNQKRNDVEIWNMAVREEEKKAMEKYCKDHGQEEVEHIKKAIEDKHAKELDNKKSLESAKPAYQMFKSKLLSQRR